MPANPLSPEPNPAPGFRDNPNKTIVISPHEGKVTVNVDGRTLASTDSALELVEDGYEPVLYIPFSDIDFATLARSGTRTRCPFKGEATYWHVGLPGDPARDLMWAYEKPYDEVAEIAGHGAFWPDRVEIVAD